MRYELNDASLLIVTPARNEGKNLQLLATSLKLQQYLPEMLWVIVDDGSTDDTASVAENLKVPFAYKLIRREKTGLLITGAAYSAWWQGVECGLEENSTFAYVMKLDADVNLEPNYFLEVFNVASIVKEGIFGGVITGLQREQKTYVPGPVKMYSRLALEDLRMLPVATGFDVMDEVFCRVKGYPVSVVANAKFTMTRQIGHSQGKLHGRFRNGLVCKWVGYSRLYFVLHLIRYFFRKPYVFGFFWMLAGYLSADKGPYPEYLRMAHASMQLDRLAKILRNPYRTIRELYF